MSKWLGMLALLGVIMWQPAVATPWGHLPSLQSQDRRAQPRGPAPREQRDASRERRALPERPERQSQRLTDEERRELRRDIDRADRDIYRRDRGR
jgi:hypothetical protein